MSAAVSALQRGHTCRSHRIYDTAEFIFILQSTTIIIMDPAMDKASAYPQDPMPALGPPPSQGQGAAPEFRLRVLLEPRGFLRAIEFVLAVCMFATTAGYATMYKFSTFCPAKVDYQVAVSYPFRISGTPLPAICNQSEGHHVSSNPSGSAQFFVAVGVLAMLYTIGALIWYILFEARYLEKGMHSIIDLVVTAVFVLLFFIASCAWAAGLNDVKYWTNFDNLMDNPLVYGPVCSTASTPTPPPTPKCASTSSAQYTSLSFSVVFGFLNTVVWGGNLWFIYKETSWFKQRMEGKAAGEKPADPNTV